MSQRNPMNDRYTTDEHVGKTRKSAASAKPKKKAASSVYIEGKNTVPKKKGLFGGAAKPKPTQEQKRDANAERTTEDKATAAYYRPDTPEYKKWRRIWWVAIVFAIVATGVSFLLSQTGVPEGLVYGTLGLGYAALLAAIVIDMWKVRKIRNEYRDSMYSSKSKEATRARKEEKAEAKRKYEEAQAAEAAKKAEREAKKAKRSGFLWTKGSSTSAGTGAGEGESGTDTSKDAKKAAKGSK